MCCRKGSGDSKWCMCCKESYPYPNHDCFRMCCKGSPCLTKVICVLYLEKNIVCCKEGMCVVERFNTALLSYALQRSPTSCKEHPRAANGRSRISVQKRGLPLLITCAAQKGLVFPRAMCGIGVVCPTIDYCHMCCKQRQYPGPMCVAKGLLCCKEHVRSEKSHLCGK